MKQRIFAGWTITRVLYIGMGAVVMMESIMEHQWIGVIIGGYFAAMGIFSFGCAAGNCNRTL